MNILVYGIHYHPDLIGIPKYSGEMCEWLVANGHDVEVITGKPFYPEWKVADEYKKKWWYTEQLNGVKVHRCPLYVPQNPTAGKKIIHEGLFVLASLVFWLRSFFTRYDVIITVCPPFHIGLLSSLVAKLRGIPHLFHVQDLQVDIANDLGMIKNKALLSLLFKLERVVMKNATTVSTISDGMKAKIMSKGIEAEQMYFFPNWVDADFIYPLSKEESLKKEFGFSPEDKIVLYSGNLGEKQGLEYVVGAAEQLKKHKHIQFVIVGSGAGKDKIQELVAQKGLQSNVHFYPLQPYEKLPALLAMGDVHLVLQKKGASDLILPSKLTSILAAGGCPLVTAEEGTTLHKVVTENEIGFVTQPENTEAMTQMILHSVYANTSSIAANARKFSLHFLDKQNILKNLERQLCTMAKIPMDHLTNVHY